MKYAFLLVVLMVIFNGFGQNVGIGTIAPSGGLTNVTISNYPVSMAAGQQTNQFKANHITPSTNTGVQAIYSTIIVKPN